MKFPYKRPCMKFPPRHVSPGMRCSLPLFMLLCLLAPPAQAQLDQAWTFSPQNRASIAALMRQVENEGRNTPAISAGGSATTLICGGEGEAGARGNSSCIILNDSDGTINIGQDSVGDQTASSENTETVNVEENISGADEILETLQGG